MKQLLSLLFILCLLVLSLIGCRAQPSMDSAPTPTAPTESTAAIPASADAVTEGTQPQPETAKDTPQASSEPYALRHTVHDFSAQLPSDLPKTIGGEITNLYANDAGLHMYVNNRQTAQASIYTFSPGSAEAEVFPVSKIENNFPRYAHRLSDHRLIVVAKKNYHDHLFLTEENGNIMLSDQYMLYSIPKSEFTEIKYIEDIVSVSTYQPNTPMSRKCRESGLKIKNGYIHFAEYLSVRFTHEGEEHEIRFPTYEATTLSRILSIYPKH